MPNWCFNTLTIQGPKEQVDSIKAKLNEPFQRQHEQWNMETHQMEIKDYFYNNPVFAFWNIYNPIQDGVSNDTYLQQNDHSKPLAEQMMFKGNNWYDWNVRNWGTKWDVGVGDEDKYPDTELLEHESNGEDQWLVYKFNTAWSAPLPAMEKLSALVPNCVVTLSFEEESGWGGEYEFVKGEITAEFNYENQCRDCDETDCMEYCDNDCGEICNKCNWLGEADLECVAECDTHKVFLDDEHIPQYRRVQA
jgi:hypothetical protein